MWTVVIEKYRFYVRLFTSTLSVYKLNVGVLNLEFTFKGTAASEKGDKDQFSVCTPDKITPLNTAGPLGLGADVLMKGTLVCNLFPCVFINVHH